VQYAFECFTRCGVGENAVCKSITAKAAVGRYHLRAENLTNFLESRFAWFDELARENVGVHDSNATL
jgi:hypothetical protein